MLRLGKWNAPGDESLTDPNGCVGYSVQERCSNSKAHPVDPLLFQRETLPEEGVTLSYFFLALLFGRLGLVSCIVLTFHVATIRCFFFLIFRPLYWDALVDAVFCHGLLYGAAMFRSPFIDPSSVEVGSANPK